MQLLQDKWQIRHTRVEILHVQEKAMAYKGHTWKAVHQHGFQFVIRRSVEPLPAEGFLKGSDLVGPAS